MRVRVRRVRVRRVGARVRVAVAMPWRRIAASMARTYGDIGEI